MIASISLDLDNKWSYMKTHGDAGWEQFPSYLDSVVPRILGVLEDSDLHITFFIVGQDAVLSKNNDVLRSIVDSGHEIGNHSFHHEPWLHLYSSELLHAEFEKSESAILESTGVRPVGFRGPGFSRSPSVLEMLQKRGYRYDGSTFPTFLGPVARLYYFMHSRLAKADREQRKELFGAWNAGFQSLRPSMYFFDDRDQLTKNWTDRYLVEIPVTTFPWLKIPIHFSYVMYLASFSPQLAKMYFKTAMHFCIVNRIEPSILLHPLDFLGADETPELKFFPGMSLSSKRKTAIASELLHWMSQKFECMTMLEHAEWAERKLIGHGVASQLN